MQVTMRYAVLLLLFLPAATTAIPAAAEDNRYLGTFGDWQAHQTRVGKSRACFITSAPKKSEGDYSKRGEASVIVTHWPGSKRFDEVSIVAGYPYKEDSEVTAKIGGATYELYTEGDRAWRYTGADDRKMVQAMRSGSEMVVVGTSARGTVTTDTYSLTGFTAAHLAIGKACGER